MANYVCSVRSNYVRVKDEQAFKVFLEDFECELIHAKDGRVGFVCYNGDGSTPYRYPDEESEAVALVDCEEEIGRHLCEGEVLVIEEVGSENMRFLVGVSYAYNHKGECLFVNMADALREKVAAQWGVSDVSDAAHWEE
jgi:hypothetical protein